MVYQAVNAVCGRKKCWISRVERDTSELPTIFPGTHPTASRVSDLSPSGRGTSRREKREQGRNELGITRLSENGVERGEGLEHNVMEYAPRRQDSAWVNSASVRDVTATGQRVGRSGGF